MIKPKNPLYLAGKPQFPNQDLQVLDKFTQELLATVAVAGPETISEAVSAAVAAVEPMRRLAAFERRAILSQCVAGLKTRQAEIALVLCREAGKPIRDARTEVARCIETFQTASEEAVRVGGEVIPLDFAESSRAYRGQWKRVPIGPCSFISPFNFPLNLAAHKIAPAIAAGCPFVLKPASLTPLSALILGEILAETKLPEGAFSILPCHREGAELFTTDDRFKLLSFTGSPAVGWNLKNRAGRKKVVLELGGNAACIVDEDCELKDTVERMVVGGFSNSGQSCISVQRILVHEKVYNTFREALVARVKTLKSGNPLEEETVVGPMISEKEAARLEKWIQDAQTAGARVLVGGKRKGSLLEPTVVESVPVEQPLCAEEAFGPVVLLSRFSTFDEALRLANQTRFGLQAGVFTQNIHHAFQAWEELDVGGVIVGDVPSWRSDPMPYGGVKESGLGREGVRFAMEDMTEVRLLVVRSPTL